MLSLPAHAHVAELADAYASGAYGETHGGSSPLVSTMPLSADGFKGHLERVWQTNATVNASEAGNSRYRIVNGSGTYFISKGRIRRTVKDNGPYQNNAPNVFRRGCQTRLTRDAPPDDCKKKRGKWSLGSASLLACPANLFSPLSYPVRKYEKTRIL